MLGIARENDSIAFNSYEDSDVLMDFILHERIADNRSVVEVYREKIGGRNDSEKKILDAFASSYTSLFRVISVSEQEKSLLISDILNKKINLKLIDISFSETATPGKLLFIRLVPFNEFNMTSGISFVFSGHLARYLIKKQIKMYKNMNIDNDAIKRFISFFKLNNAVGLEVTYEDTSAWRTNNRLIMD